MTEHFKVDLILTLFIMIPLSRVSTKANEDLAQHDQYWDMLSRFDSRLDVYILCTADLAVHPLNFLP